MPGTFEPDKAGLAALARSPEVGQAMVDAAESAIPYAQSISPVLTGEYRDSFAAFAVDVDVAGETRAGAVLTNTSSHAWAVEWGQGAEHVLARSVDAIERGT
jgi:hypothetical protein